MGGGRGGRGGWGELGEGEFGGLGVEVLFGAMVGVVGRGVGVVEGGGTLGGEGGLRRGVFDDLFAEGGFGEGLEVGLIVHWVGN